MSDFESIDRNMPILVVDDLSAMRRIVKNCLRKLGFENIVEADSAESALAELDKSEFKFIISDWNMDTAQGSEFLHVAHAKLKDVPVLVVAAEAHKRAAAQAVQDESKMIVKPFTADLLQRKMEAILSK